MTALGIWSWLDQILKNFFALTLTGTQIIIGQVVIDLKDAELLVQNN